MDWNTLGGRLKQARELARLTQQKAAEILNLPRTAITQMESGNRCVSTLELTKFAKIYKHSVTELLKTQDNAKSDSPLIALYRAVPGLEKDLVVKDQINTYFDWCKEGYNLEQILDLNRKPSPPSYPEAIPNNTKEAIEQGERVAAQERGRLGIGHAPIADIADLIAKQNIWTSGVAFTDNISGLFLHHSSIGLAILINSSHSVARKRFSYAHEYAHALLDRNLEVKISDENNASDMLEKRANSFAASFLMPAEGVDSLLSSLGKNRRYGNSKALTCHDIALLAHHFGVSYQTAAYRLKNLSSISAKELTELVTQANIGKEYLRLLSFEDIEQPFQKESCQKELRERIIYLAVEAYSREEISRGKLADLALSLQIPANKILNLVDIQQID